MVSLDERAKDGQKPFLEQLLQEGARKLLQAAIEVIEYIQFHKDRRDDNGQRLVVSGVGPIPVRQPRGPPSGPRTLYQCDSAQVNAAGSQRRCLTSKLFTSKGSRPAISAKR